MCTEGDGCTDQKLVGLLDARVGSLHPRNQRASRLQFSSCRSIGDCVARHARRGRWARLSRAPTFWRGTENKGVWCPQKAPTRFLVELAPHPPYVARNANIGWYVRDQAVPGARSARKFEGNRRFGSSKPKIFSETYLPTYPSSPGRRAARATYLQPLRLHRILRTTG